MVKTKSFVFYIFLLCLLLVGCSNQDTKKAENDGYVRIKFKQQLETLKQYDGKKVKIIGFMSTLSPLQGEYVYLMNMPYQQCPFCVPNSNEIANTVAVYAPKGKKFPFVDYPIEAKGVLEFGNFKDEAGYEYKVRIVDAEISKADVSGLSKEIKLYTDLVDSGFARNFTKITEEALNTIKYKEKGLDKSELKQIDTSLFDDMYGVIEKLGKEKYKEPLESLDMLKNAVDNINNDIKTNNVDKLELRENEVVNAYNTFYNWLIKPNL